MVLTPFSTIFQLYRGGQWTLVQETKENHRPVASHWQTSILWSQISVFWLRYRVDSNLNFSNTIHLSPKCCIELTTLVVIGTNYTGSWKNNYYTITTTTTHTNVVIYLKITEGKRKTTGVFNNDNLFANRNKTSFIGCEST